MLVRWCLNARYLAVSPYRSMAMPIPRNNVPQSLRMSRVASMAYAPTAEYA